MGNRSLLAARISYRPIDRDALGVCLGSTSISLDSAVLHLLAIVARRPPKEHVTLRLAPAIKNALRRQATREGLTQTGLAERYLDESVRVAEHPGIVFRSGPAGRRAAVVGGPDVWEIVETFMAEGRNTDATARYFDLPPGLVKAAVDYYADYPEEVDTWVRRNQDLADELEAAAARRRRAVGA